MEKRVHGRENGLPWATLPPGEPLGGPAPNGVVLELARNENLNLPTHLLPWSPARADAVPPPASPPHCTRSRGSSDRSLSTAAGRTLEPWRASVSRAVSEERTTTPPETPVCDAEANACWLVCVHSLFLGMEHAYIDPQISA